MRLLFVHDARFQRRGDGVYSCGAFPNWRWRRYLRHFDEVRVIGRDAGETASERNKTRSDEPGVTFQFVRDINTIRGLVLHRHEARAALADAIQKADAVIAQLPSQLGLAAVDLARRLGKPLLVEVAGCAWDASVNHGSPLLRLYAPLFFRRNRKAIAQATQVIYVTSRWLQDRYPTNGEHVGASNVEIVPLDANGIRNREARLAEIAKGRSPRLGTIASLTPRYKGLQLAIEAVKRLREEGLPLSYSILGAGDPAPWRALAQDMGVADLVQFDGIREAGADVRAWLDTVDIHLQPSLQEGLPRATIEAMSRGAACVGSICGGIPELLPPEQLHIAGDVSGLVDRIRSFATDPERLARAAWAGVERTRPHYPETLNGLRDPAYAQLKERAKSRRNPG